MASFSFKCASLLASAASRWISITIEKITHNGCLCQGKSSECLPVCDMSVAAWQAFMCSPKSQQYVLAGNSPFLSWQCGKFSEGICFWSATNLRFCMNPDQMIFCPTLFSVMKPHFIYQELSFITVCRYGAWKTLVKWRAHLDSPKVNVFCALSVNKVYGPFFFMKQSITGTAYLNMVELWLMPQLEEDHGSTFFLQ